MKVRISGRKYPRGSLWRRRQAEALVPYCEVSKVPLYKEVGTENGTIRVPHGGTVDHIIPERLIRRFMPGLDPHALVNLICVSREVHGRKTGIDRKLWKGPDVLGFLQALRQEGYPMDRVFAALDYCSLRYPK